jgi:hypothetical protein
LFTCRQLNSGEHAESAAKSSRRAQGWIIFIMGEKVMAQRAGYQTHKKKPAPQARAKNFQGVVLQRRTGFIVFPKNCSCLARTQSVVVWLPKV